MGGNGHGNGRLVFAAEFVAVTFEPEETATRRPWIGKH